jgi:alpha-L-rhamnosidase
MNGKQMRYRWYYIIVFLLGAGPVVAQKAEGLTCEQRIDPLGIDVARPRLGWRVMAARQTAYQVVVLGTKGELWNSGKVESGQSWMVPYGGKALESREVCRWKVKVWTAAGESKWSEEGRWTMGLLNASDWKAKWIGYDGGFPWDSVSKFSRLSARYFRRNFYSDKGIRRATLYIAGLGHYELRVNGVPVEKDLVLAQAPTDYTRSVLYRTFEVPCRRGENVIDVVLGNGRFFTMRPKYKPKKIKEFGFPKLLLQLELEDSSGKRRTIVSDTSWRFTADGPIRSNNEYDGEECDARKELKDWMKPQVVGSPGGRLRSQMNPDMGVLDVVHPQRLWKAGDSVWMLDMGQNMAGWLRMRVSGARGTVVRLRFGETLKTDGELYVANLRDAKATDVYTLKGEGVEDWRPSFVFHGFRYVEISGYPGMPAADDFEGEVVGDKMEGTGKIETSDTILNKILKNAWWGIGANYKGMPVDCPQRNERMPWLGDRATGSLGESYFFGNGMLYAKWLDDIEESQKPDGQLPDVAPAYWNYYSDNMTWPGVYLMVADMLYRQYADVAPIKKHYGSMKKWMNYMGAKYAVDGIMTKDKYGDWCVPPESPQLIHSKDSSRMTDGKLIATAYYYHLLGLMKEFAVVSGFAADAGGFGVKAEKVKAAFNKRFFDAGGFYSNNSVTANLLPLYFGMVPEDKKEVVFRHITDKIGHISTGVIGTQWLMRGLTENGRADLAYKLATNTDYPSWGYMVKQGATTIWELWNGNTADPAMNSQNHVMLLGDLVTWCFEDLGGIAPGAPGFKKIRMKPVFPVGLNFVKASYTTPYGDVVSNWKRDGGVIRWDIAVPCNAEAEVFLPSGEVKKVGSGNYHYEIK